MSKVIYLDNAATTRISPVALAAMREVYEGDAFANPSSQHAAGDAALRALEGARGRVAACLHARPSEVCLTSGGSEANNQALLTGAAYGARTGRRHIVASAIEHPSVLRMLERLASADGPFGGNFELTLVRPDATGIVSVAAVKEAMRADTCLVSLMYANNEVGSVQPERDVCRAARKRGALFHTDAVQAAGHLPIDFTRDGFDLLSVSAHKFHGPRGAGALLCSHRLVPESLVVGGAQERGHRAGTVDVAAACGMAAALEEGCAALAEREARLAELRERLERGLAGIGGVTVLGPRNWDGCDRVAAAGTAHEENRAVPDVDTPQKGVFVSENARLSRHGEADVSVAAGAAALSPERPACLPGIVGVAVEGVSREAALVLADERGICVSAGSACAAGAVEESHVLAAMGVPPEAARGYLRISLDAVENNEAEVDRAVEVLADVISQLRRRAGGGLPPFAGGISFNESIPLQPPCVGEEPSPQPSQLGEPLLPQLRQGGGASLSQRLREDGGRS